jgi:hypothetical protein
MSSAAPDAARRTAGAIRSPAKPAPAAIVRLIFCVFK